MRQHLLNYVVQAKDHQTEKNLCRIYEIATAECCEFQSRSHDDRNKLGVADGGTTGEVLVVGMLADYVTELGMIVRSIGDAKSTLFFLHPPRAVGKTKPYSDSSTGSA